MKQFQGFCENSFSLNLQKLYLTVILSSSEAASSTCITTYVLVYEKVDTSNNWFFKWAFPGLFFSFTFVSFQTNITILRQIHVNNVHPVYGARIRTHHL